MIPTSINVPSTLKRRFWRMSQLLQCWKHAANQRNDVVEERVVSDQENSYPDGSGFLLAGACSLSHIKRISSKNFMTKKHIMVFDCPGTPGRKSNWECLGHMQKLTSCSGLYGYGKSSF